MKITTFTHPLVHLIISSCLSLQFKYMILHMFTCISVLKEYQYDYTVNARAFQDFKIKKSATKLNITLYSYRSKGLQHYTRVKRVYYTHTARSFLLFIVTINTLSNYMYSSKRTQPWTDCLSHKFFMDIAHVISFFWLRPFLCVPNFSISKGTYSQTLARF